MRDDYLDFIFLTAQNELVIIAEVSWHKNSKLKWLSKHLYLTWNELEISATLYSGFQFLIWVQMQGATEDVNMLQVVQGELPRLPPTIVEVYKEIVDFFIF